MDWVPFAREFGFPDAYVRSVASDTCIRVAAPLLVAMTQGARAKRHRRWTSIAKVAANLLEARADGGIGNGLSAAAS